jgi:hypothetical protein
LDKLCFQLVTEKAIQFQWIILIGRVNRAENIVLHTMLRQQPPAAHHLRKAARPALVHAIGIMQLSRPINANANEKIVLLKELTPGIIQQRAIGLQGIVNLHPWSGMFLLVMNDSFKKAQTHEGRFTTLPGKCYLGNFLRFDVLAHKCFQQFIGHAEAAARIHHLLGQEVTIFAVQIANRACRFGHDVEGADGRGSSLPFTHNADE